MVARFLLEMRSVSQKNLVFNFIKVFNEYTKAFSYSQVKLKTTVLTQS